MIQVVYIYTYEIETYSPRPQKTLPVIWCAGVGLFLVNDIPYRSDQIRLEDAQCFETYEKTIFRFWDMVDLILKILGKLGLTDFCEFYSETLTSDTR